MSEEQNIYCEGFADATNLSTDKFVIPMKKEIESLCKEVEELLKALELCEVALKSCQELKYGEKGFNIGLVRDALTSIAQLRENKEKVNKV